MKREEILYLLDKTSQDDDAGFRKIISAILDGKFLTIRDVAHSVGAGGTTVGRWRDGKNSPHPYMRKHVFKALKELLMCVCPKKCDCENPPPDDWDGKTGGPYHSSMMCPEHNFNPRPDPDCPVHN